MNFDQQFPFSGFESTLSASLKTPDQAHLSLIYACSKNHLEPVIDKDAAKWACEFAEWTCSQMLLMIERYVAENAFHAIWLRIEDVIRNNGGRASQSLLINKLKLSSKQLMEAIEAMGIPKKV